MRRKGEHWVSFMSDSFSLSGCQDKLKFVGQFR
jgi:hypothetical protein